MTLLISRAVLILNPKSVRNKANRQRNSDFANSCKTANAAAKQIQAINVIRNTKGLGYLSDEMRELAADLRELNIKIAITFGNRIQPRFARRSAALG